MVVQKLGGLTLGAWIGLLITLVILTAIFVAVLTFFLTRRFFIKQLKENPPISEKTIRMLYSQMGRKLSEAQVRSIMRNVQEMS